jgi:hypothetical protein
MAAQEREQMALLDGGVLPARHEDGEIGAMLEEPA